MEGERPEGTEGAEGPKPADDIPSLPPEVAATEEELRRQVEAGAASPEEIRALAARLEARRFEEQSAWRQEVKPALIRSKRLRHRLPREEPSPPLPGEPEPAPSHTLFLGGMLMVALLLLVLVALKASLVWLLLPVIGVLGYAWWLGRQETDDESPRGGAD